MSKCILKSFKKAIALFLFLQLSGNLLAVAETNSISEVSHQDYHERYQLLIESYDIYFGMNLDSALFKLDQIIATNDDIATLAESHYLTGSLYSFSPKSDSAIPHFVKAIDLADKIDYLQISFRAYNHMGMVYAYKKSYAQSLDNFSKAHNLAKMFQDTTMLIMVSNNFGIVYNRLELYDEALKWHNGTLQMLRHTKLVDTMRMVSHLTNVGALYDRLGLDAMALATWKEALQYTKIGTVSLFINLATAYLKTGDHQKAMEYAEKAIRLAEQNNEVHVNVKINTYRTMANALHAQNKKKKALEFAHKAIRVSKNSQKDTYLSEVYNELGEIFEEINQSDSATYYYNLSLEQAIGTQNTQMQAEALRNLADFYKSRGNTSRALAYLEDYLAAYDTLNSRAKKNEAEKYKVLINYRDIENQHQQLIREHQLSKLQIAKERDFRIGLTLFSMLIIVLIIYIYRVYYIKKHQAQKLELLVDQKTAELKKEIEEKDSLNQQLQIETHKAQESDRLKSAFLLNISHEIRTPMNGILGFSGLLLNKDLSRQDQEKYHDIIEKSSNRLLNTINDLIDISRIESGEIQINAETVDVTDLVLHLMDFFQLMCNEKGLQLKLHENLTTPPLVVRTDKNKLNSIFTNLLRNAVKYTEKGTIEIGVNRLADHYEFFVIDTGIGIDSHRQSAIFERFVQEDIEDRDAWQGSGLGLAIAKSYVEMLGGRIRVKSEKGKGSTFFFTLPADIEMPIQTTENELKENPFASDLPILHRRLKVLIAEDDDVSFEYFATLLQPYNCEIIHCTNGKEAVEKCKTDGDIDMILMDIKMPVMNGYVAARQIREFNADVYILFQSAHAFTLEKEKAMLAGGNEYITKPVDRSRFFSILQQVIERAEGTSK